MGLEEGEKKKLYKTPEDGGYEEKSEIYLDDLIEVADPVRIEWKDGECVAYGIFNGISRGELLFKTSSGNVCEHPSEVIVEKIDEEKINEFDSFLSDSDIEELMITVDKLNNGWTPECGEMIDIDILNYAMRFSNQFKRGSLGSGTWYTNLVNTSTGWSSKLEGIDLERKVVVEITVQHNEMSGQMVVDVWERNLEESPDRKYPTEKLFFHISREKFEGMAEELKYEKIFENAKLSLRSKLEEQKEFIRNESSRTLEGEYASKIDDYYHSLAVLECLKEGMIEDAAHLFNELEAESRDVLISAVLPSESTKNKREGGG